MRSKKVGVKLKSWNGRIFRPERSLIMVFWLLFLIVPSSCFFILGSTSHDHIMMFVMSTILIFAYFLVMVAMQAQSNIIISDVGIERCIFGIVWQKVRWDNMRVIRVFDSYKPTKKNNRSFNIFPINSQPINPFGRKIIFNDKMGEWLEFLEILNRYVEQYHIKIESTTGGVATSPTHL